VDKIRAQSITARCRETHRRPQNVVVSHRPNLYIVVQATKTNKQGSSSRMIHFVTALSPVMMTAFAAPLALVVMQKTIQGWLNNEKDAAAVIAGRPCYDILA